MADLVELRSLVYRGMGLVVGPSVTTYNGVLNDCVHLLYREFPSASKNPEDRHLFDVAERIAQQTPENATNRNVPDTVRDFFRRSTSNPQLNVLVRGRWTAVVSLSADPHFENALRAYYDKQPTPWNVTTVARPEIQPAPRTIPVYQLLGDPLQPFTEWGSVCLRSHYLARRRSWPKLLRSFPDYVKGDPLFFVGTDECSDLVFDFVNELIGLGHQSPRRFIFLTGDRLLNDPRLLGLLKGWGSIIEAKCTLGELCNFLDEKWIHGNTSPPPAKASDPFDPSALFAADSQIAYVAHHAVEANVSEEKHRLLDLMFSPTNLDWGPYAAKLDFPREVTDRLEHEIALRLEKQSSLQNSCILVNGEAGAGKTVALKRSAFNLAAKGSLCIWLRKGYGLEAGARFDAAIKAIEAAIQGRKTKVVFFYDDPIGGRILARDVLNAITNARFQWVVVFSLRNSDFVQLHKFEEAFYRETCHAIEIPTAFTDDEMLRFPDYLVSLGGATDRQSANALVQTLSHREAQGTLFNEKGESLFKDGRDLLCALWYLLPQTRSALSQSLTNEYIRLGGGLQRAVQDYVDASQERQEVARTAYELVTTTSGLGMTVPTEVLVSALRISYEEWISMCGARKPLWGLLYAEIHEEAQTYSYRTRNHVVTKILLSILNGGTTSHAGEYRCLERLVKACNSGAVPYREFLCDLLIRRKGVLEQRLTFEQGLSLFNAALETFPLQDRTLAHHRALWIKEVGRLPLEAYNALVEVQRVGEYPAATRGEPIEHIHTSMAACALQAVAQKEIEIQKGAEMVHEHIGQASTPNLFDLHSQHVHASTLLRLADDFRPHSKEQSLQCLQEACRIIDRALLIVQPLSDEKLELLGAQQLFSELKAELHIALDNVEELEKFADEIFSTKKSQIGYVATARVMLAKAKARKSGKLFNHCQDYINQAIRRVESAGAQVSPDLLLCRADLFISWLVVGQKASIPWETIKDDLKTVVATAQFSRDPVWIFYLSVALFQLGERPLAEAWFSALRQWNMSGLLRSPYRCFFLNTQGQAQTFQGILKSGASNRFISSHELGSDLMVRRGDFKQPDGATVLFKVAFSMLGPLAVPHTMMFLRDVGRY